MVTPETSLSLYNIFVGLHAYLPHTETQQQIEQLSLTQLEALGEDLLFFGDLGALEDWFIQNQ